MEVCEYDNFYVKAWQYNISSWEFIVVISKFEYFFKQYILFKRQFNSYWNIYDFDDVNKTLTIYNYLVVGKIYDIPGF